MNTPCYENKNSPVDLNLENAIKIGKAMGGGKAIITDVVFYDYSVSDPNNPLRKANGYNNGNGKVYINLEKSPSNISKMTDAERKSWMNTVSHEVRHQYQHEVANRKIKKVSKEEKKKAKRIKQTLVKPQKDYPGYLQQEHEEDARLSGSIAVSEIK